MNVIIDIEYDGETGRWDGFAYPADDEASEGEPICYVLGLRSAGAAEDALRAALEWTTKRLMRGGQDA